MNRQARAAADAADGPRGGGAEAAAERAASGASGVSVSAARRADRRGPTRCGAPTSRTCGLRHGFVYLVAILDWFSRYVLAWELSMTVDGQFCRRRAGDGARPEHAGDLQHGPGRAVHERAVFTDRVKAAGAQISMDGRGRAFDNVFVERLWRSVKYEEVYLKDYGSVPDARVGVGSVLPLLQSRAPAPGARRTGRRRRCMRRRRQRNGLGGAVGAAVSVLVSDSDTSLDQKRPRRRRQERRSARR